MNADLLLLVETGLQGVVQAPRVAEIMSPDWLCHLWFVILCFLLTGYAILDGFDLGVGIIHFLIARDDRERAAQAGAIGPFWDGNEVWLVTFGGALFASFPLAYGSIFSAFMVPVMIVLFCLILRATSLEFRSKAGSRFMRFVWDLAFSGSSLLATFLFGASVGAVMGGIPIDDSGALKLEESSGMMAEITFAITPLSVASGMLAVTLFALHGLLFLNLRTTGEYQSRVRKAFPALYAAFVLVFVATTVLALRDMPPVGRSTIWIAVVATLNVLAVLNLPRAMYYGRPWGAFMSSSLVIAALVFLFGRTVHPNLLTSSLDAAWNIDIFEAASTKATMLTMLVVVCFGVPFVMLYTAITYWTFRGTLDLSGGHTEEGCIDQDTK
ncbi:MAG: cytochrome d ubiquinol oxidase subunit II [Phycisphaerae bacterium]|nr:cytochrome d ubiquinol oxidase subunit II [Phycisphaerae bacterium]